MGDAALGRSLRLGGTNVQLPKPSTVNPQGNYGHVKALIFNGW
jgi:hypothetical protein